MKFSQPKARKIFNSPKVQAPMPGKVTSPLSECSKKKWSVIFLNALCVTGALFITPQAATIWSIAGAS